MAYYTNTFNSVRSSMALGMGMLAVHYLLQNKNWKYLLVCLIAIEIHKSIFPVLFLYFLKNIKPTWTLLLGVIGFAVVLSQILNLEAIFNALILYNPDYTDELTGGGYSMLALDIALTFFIFYCVKHDLTPFNRLMVNIMCMATCIQAFAPIFSLMTRIALFFTVYIIIMLPKAIEEKFTPESRKIATTALLICCLLYFQVFIMTPSMVFEDGVVSNSQRTIPYTFCWQ